jgi:hypothetical protein
MGIKPRLDYFIIAMIDYRVPKSYFDPWNALYDHLESLKDALQKGESHNLRNLAGTMRLLVADRSSGSNGGLLLRLVIDTGYRAPIGWVWRGFENLQSLLKEDVRKILSINIDVAMAVEEFIRDEAQRSGSSHEDTRYQNILGYTLRNKRTENTDPYRGAVMSLGLVLLIWGNEFYNMHAPAQLKRRIQVK